MSSGRSRRLTAATVTACAALSVAATLTATIATDASASPASTVDTAPSGGVTNPYSPAYGHPYRHGVVPTRELNTQMHRWEAQTKGARPSSSKTLSYGGGVDGIGVTSGGAPKVYLVFYGSQWGTQGTDGNGNATFSGDPKTGAPLVQKLFKGLGTGGEAWSGVMTQYCDGAVAKGATSCPPSGASHVLYPTGGAYAGVWYDNAVASPTNATAKQLGDEAVKAAAHFTNTTATANRDAQYVILSPTGTHPDGFNTASGQFCAWHDYNADPYVGSTSPYGDIAFTNMPYVMDMGTSCGQNFVNSGSAGTDDGYTIVEGHEYAETITDQNPAGGWTNTTSRTYSGQENADECAWISPGSAGGAGNVSTTTGSFAMQATWSNDTNRCDLSHATVG
jgi:serine protease